MEQFKGQNIIDFMKEFPDDTSCKRYLADLKWHDGFKCSKCAHNSGRRRVVTDKWKGYTPLKQEYDISQVPSNNGKNFKELHLIIHQIKSWIRTIPTHESKHHMNRYLNEFSFRLNRSQNF